MGLGDAEKMVRKFDEKEENRENGKTNCSPVHCKISEIRHFYILILLFV